MRYNNPLRRVGRRARWTLSDLRDVLWRARHRRCIAVRRLRPEHWTVTDLDRVCRRCRDLMMDEEIRQAQRWR